MRDTSASRGCGRHNAICLKCISELIDSTSLAKILWYARTYKFGSRAVVLDASVSLSALLLPLCKTLPDMCIAPFVFEGCKLKDIHGLP